MELIHVATLIHDDVVDNADTRRGVNATAVDFGNRVSVLAGDYLFAWIFKNVTATYSASDPAHPQRDAGRHHRRRSAAAARARQPRPDGRRVRRDRGRRKPRGCSPARPSAARWAAGGSALKIAAAARVRPGLRDRVPDAGRSARHDLDRERARQTGRQRPAPNRKITIPLILALAAGDREFRADVERFYAGDDTTAGADRRRHRRDSEARGLRENEGADRRVPRTCQGRAGAARKRAGPRGVRRGSRCVCW